MKRLGFTLIELLVVVAIISILASIAIPNMVDAQTRAKLARTKSDMRTIAGALDLYYVDWNSYTYYNEDAQNHFAGNIDPTKPYICPWAGYRQLTTPIAYLTVIPMDFFNSLAANGPGHMCYTLGTGTDGQEIPAQAPWTHDKTPVEYESLPAHSWILSSVGPDGKQNNPTHVIRKKAGKEDRLFLMWLIFWPNWYALESEPEPLDPVQTMALVMGIYDPTNGTVSRGDLYRAGGMAPTRAYAKFFYPLIPK